MKWILTCLLCLLSLTICRAQRSGRAVPAAPDTTFSIRSEFSKQLRYFPGIAAAAADTAGLEVKRGLVYRRCGRRELHADLFRERASVNLPQPAVVLIHGGGWRSGHRSMDWPMAAALARAGFAALCIEYRLSTEALFPAPVEDLHAAISWMRQHAVKYGFDPERIALYGTSAGGQLAALVGSANGSRAIVPGNRKTRLRGPVRAVVDIDGILAFIHPGSGEGADKPGKPSASTLWLGASADEGPERWHQASPLTHVNACSAPILFLNSSQPRFHAGRDDYRIKLDSLGIYSEVHTLENTPHTFWLFHPWFDRTAALTTAFLRKLLVEKQPQPTGKAE